MVERLERFISTHAGISDSGPVRPSREYKLDRGKQSVLGYFPNNSKAQKALQEIRGLGFEVAQMHPVSLPGNMFNGSENTESGLSELGQMVIRDHEQVGDNYFLLTVVADNTRTPDLVRVIKENGGSI